MPTIEVLALNTLLQGLPKRAKDANKSDFGRILVVGGDLGMSGAVHMAGEAALRAGAGLVHIATHPAHAASLNVSRPELMVKGVAKPEDLTPLLEASTVLVLGPGLGQSEWGQALWKQCIAYDKPMVIDADALNILAKHPRTLPQAILTPHPGEAARLLNTSPEAIQANRTDAIVALHQKYQGVIVLKGHHSLVFDGGNTIYQCDQGNPGMATAGMGDILSGVIAGLLPQCKTPLDAANLGVCIHAKAGDLAAAQGERGLIATDLLPYIRQILG